MNTTVSEALSVKDRHKVELYTEGPAITCFSLTGHFLGFGVKEKGIFYFLPVGSKVMHSEGELVVVIDRLVSS